MLKSGDKLADKLGKSLVQVLDLSALSTGRRQNGFLGSVLYPPKRTVNARLLGGFTQPSQSVLNLLLKFLYSVSTVPITNTKFIKG